MQIEFGVILFQYALIFLDGGSQCMYPDLNMSFRIKHEILGMRFVWPILRVMRRVNKLLAVLGPFASGDIWMDNLIFQHLFCWQANLHAVVK